MLLWVELVEMKKKLELKSVSFLIEMSSVSGIQKTNALFASTVTYIIPLFATMWGWLDDEPLTLLHLVGGAVVLGGVWLVSRGGK